MQDAFEEGNESGEKYSMPARNQALSRVAALLRKGGAVEGQQLTPPWSTVHVEKHAQAVALRIRKDPL